MSDNVEKLREDFEEWFTGGKDKTILKKDGVGNYTYMAAYTSWNGWLAAKQNQPVVELPNADIVFDENDMPYEYYEPEIIHTALTAAGIPYKIKGE